MPIDLDELQNRTTRQSVLGGHGLDVVNMHGSDFDALITELLALRARVAELEADRQAERDRVLGARVREIASQHDAHLDMYLRDRLAEKAIQGLLANPSGPIQANGMSGWGLCNCTIEQVADFAWHIADHMLKARGGSDG